MENRQKCYDIDTHNDRCLTCQMVKEVMKELWKHLCVWLHGVGNATHLHTILDDTAMSLL